MNENDQNGTAPNAQEQAPDLAGYKDIDGLLKGYRESSKEAQAWRERAMAAERAAEMAWNARPAIPQRKTPDDELAELGIPPQTLAAYVQNQVQQSLAPITQGLAARQQVLADHPDYVKYEAQVSQFVNANLERQDRYNRMFQADPVGAMEWAMLNFTEDQRSRQPQQTQPAGGAAGAAIPTQRNGGARPEVNGSDAAAAAYEKWLKTGSSQDAAAFAKIRIMQNLRPEFLQGR